MKLSELPNGAMICVKYSSETATILTKEEYIQEREEHKGKPVFTTETVTVVFEWENLIGLYDDEMYDGWDERVLDDITASEELMNAQKLINEILARNAAYCPVEEIDLEETENEK